MTEIGPNQCRILRADMEVALAQIAAKHGITMNLGKMTYSGTSVLMQVEAAIIAEGGIVLNRAAKDFQDLASLYNLEPDDLGKAFTLRGEQYKITGLAPRRSKMPILGERLRDGAGMKFPISSVLHGLGRSVPAHLRER